MKVPNHTMQWKIAAPVERWDEALPLGNGITGVLLWGDSNRIKLSLDRGDLWDERTDVATRDPDWNRAALEEIVATRDQGRLRRLDELHEKIQATKLPVGRLELTFKKTWTSGSFCWTCGRQRDVFSMRTARLCWSVSAQRT